MANLMVRVITSDYDTWLNAFVSAENGLLEADINQWTVYQDSWNSNIVMVHFIADDLDRAMAFFTSDTFKEIDARSGAIERTFFIAEQQGAPAAKPKAARKPAAKPAASKPAAKPAAKASTAAKTTSTKTTPAKTTSKTTKPK